MADFKENVIEWITGDDMATLTLTQGRYISRIKKLAVKFPNEVEIVHENKDGSMVAHASLRAIKIGLQEKRELTDEQKLELSERLRKARELGQEVDDDDDMEDEE